MHTSAKPKFLYTEHRIWVQTTHPYGYIFSHCWTYDRLLTSIHLHSNLHTRPWTRRGLEASSRVFRWVRASFFFLFSNSAGNSGLQAGEGGESEKQGGGKFSLGMGMGPKKNTVQTPDVKAPCTHTHTVKYTHKYSQTYANPDRKGGGNKGRKAAAGATLGFLWLAGLINLFFWQMHCWVSTTKISAKKMWTKGNYNLKMSKYWHEWNKSGI